MWARLKTPAHDATSALLPVAELPSPVSLLLLTDQFLPAVGGTEVTTLREAKALQACGLPVQVLTLRLNPQWPRTEQMEGVPVRRIGGFFWRGRLRMRFGVTWLAEALVWRELVRMRHAYDVVHVRQLGRLARPAVLASLVTGKPLVVRIASAPAPQGHDVSHLGAALDGESPATPQVHLKARGLTPDTGDVGILRRVQYLAPLTLRLLRATQVTCHALSTHIREYLIASGFDEHQIVQLPNGVDTTRYQEVAAGNAHRRPVAPGEILTIVCPARLSHQKGQDVLLHAWHTVQERVPTARLILAGVGPPRSQLERLANDLGIADTVEFAGLVGDTRALFATAHGVVLPSRYEGMSNALLEAMAAGMPCVATRVSGSEDVIVDGTSGLLVPPEDPVALASALVAILTDHERASSLGREARARVVRAFDQRLVVDEFIRLYSSLLQKRRHQAAVGAQSLKRRPAAARCETCIDDSLHRE
jgi:glycosyltransferase involved in cell wall biosynthesis